MLRKTNKKGFTLVELLVVIAIIGLLASIVLVSLNTVRAKARDVARKAAMKQIQISLEMFYDDNNAYPSTGGGWWGECSSYGSHPLDGSNGWVPNLAPTYMSKLPHDPDTNRRACGTGSCYLYNSNGTDYKLLAHCTPETGYSSSDPFYDPVRPTWAWQISTPNAKNW